MAAEDDFRMRMYEAQAIVIEKEEAIENLRKASQTQMEKLKKEKEELERRIQQLELHNSDTSTPSLSNQFDAVWDAMKDLQKRVGLLEAAPKVERNKENSAVQVQRKEKNKQPNNGENETILLMGKVLSGDQDTDEVVSNTEKTQYELFLLSNKRTEWKRLSLKFPNDPYSSAPVYLNGEIYTFINGSGSEFYRLDEDLDWIKLVDILDGINCIGEPSCLSFDGCVWVFGCMGSGWEVSNQVQKYVHKKAKWMKMPPMREPREGPTALAVCGKIYVCGGAKGENVRSTECYDPVSAVWTLFVDLPTKGAERIFSDGYSIFCAESFPEMTFIWRISPDDVKVRWSPVQPMDRSIRYMMTATLGDEIFAIDGRGSKDVQIYDGDIWREGPALPMPLENLSSVVIPKTLGDQLLKNTISSRF